MNEVMKPSGYEWMGDIPEDWSIKPLKYVVDDVSDSLSEGTPPDYVFRYVDIGSVSQLIGIESYKELSFGEAPSRARKKVQQGDTIVSTVRTYLKAIALIEDDDNVIVSTGFSVLRPVDLDSSYLYYLMNSEYMCQEISRRSWGIAYPAITESELIRISVPIPPSEEQRNIADFLDKECSFFDKTIDIINQQIEILEQYKQSLIHEAVTKGINPNVAMKDSGVDWIGDIPEHWSITRVKDHFEIIGGNGFPPEMQGEIEGDYPFLKASDIAKSGKINQGAANYISHKQLCNNGFNLIPAGSILMSKIGESLKKNNRTISSSDCCVDNNCQGLVPLDFNIDYAYYLWLLIDASWFDNGGPVPSVNNVKLKSSKITYPTLDEQQEIADYLDKKCAAIGKTISIKQQQLETLKQERQSLIYEYVTGKKRVTQE